MAPHTSLTRAYMEDKRGTTKKRKRFLMDRDKKRGASIQEAQGGIDLPWQIAPSTKAKGAL